MQTQSMLSQILNIDKGGHNYLIQITADAPHWGGLSGCTYKEGVSWGKFVPPEEGGRYAEIHCDASIVLPILVLAIFERLGLRN